MTRRLLLKPIRGLVSLSQRAARLLEFVAQQAQGKGWGAGTVEAETRAVRKLLGSRAEEALIVLDVGANIGTWSRAALIALPHAHIHIFEPSATAYSTLSSALAHEDRTSTYPFALGASNEVRTLYADKAGSGLGSFSKRRLDHFGISFEHEEEVTVKTLQDWAVEMGVASVDVLKMDVEGHELDVLEGAGDLLATTAIIQFEFGGANIDTRTYFQDFWYLLKPLGFDLYRLGPRGLAVIDAYHEQDEYFTTTNYVAVRK